MKYLRALIGLTLATLLLYASPQLRAEVPSPAVVITHPDSQCVAPPAEMRRNHMEMLKHQRDRTLRLGEIGAPVSLNACINCHAGKQSGSVAASNADFCESCHVYAAVKLDCFECHQARAAILSGNTIDGAVLTGMQTKMVRP